MDNKAFTKLAPSDSDGTGLQAFESMDLKALEKGKPVKERLSSVQNGIALFNRLRDDDKPRSLERARLDSMFDGESPYNQGQLNDSGQSDKTNLNFGEALRQLDISLSSYVDLYSSVETLVDLRSTEVYSGERDSKQMIASEEWSKTIRRNPTFHTNYMRLCTTFNKHGICPTFFDNHKDWMFQTCLLDDFLFPSETIANEDALDVVIIRKSYALHEVMRFIEHEDAATKLGWDVAETKRVVVTNSTSFKNTQNDYKQGYQALQASIKNNDVAFGHTNPKVALLHFLVKEMDGSVSHYMSAESLPNAYMFRSLSRYESSGNAFTLFTLGVGTNGTYHSVRGLGQRIFSHIQVSNRLRCQMVDGATLAASIMIQPENERALEELEFTFYGGYSVLSPHVSVIEKAIPDLSRSVVPALNDMQNQLAANTDTVSTYGQKGSSPYRNETQVISDLDVSTQISGSAINLFYVAWNRLLKEMTRRGFDPLAADDPEIKNFRARCEARGVDKAFLDSIDLSDTRAVRAIGGGSAANRSVILKGLMGVSQGFDETGRKNLLRDVVATQTGLEGADRYAPKAEGERPTVDDKIVFFEDQQLNQGINIPVIPSELHGKHLVSHMGQLGQIIQGLDAGEIEPTQILPVLQTFYQHISDHIQAGFGDAGLEGIIGQANQILQVTEEAINNTSKHIQKLEREATEQGGDPALDGAPEGGQQVDSKTEAHQLDMNIKREKAELDYEITQRKFEQAQSIRDAEAAIKFSNADANQG